MKFISMSWLSKELAGENITCRERWKEKLALHSKAPVHFLG